MNWVNLDEKLVGVFTLSSRLDSAMGNRSAFIQCLLSTALIHDSVKSEYRIYLIVSFLEEQPRGFQLSGT